MKKCSKCKQLKDESLFDRDKQKKDGLSYKCKACAKESLRTYNYKKYGTTIEEYNILFELQKGCCVICGRHQSEFKRALAVDHNHTTGKPRGLLCQNCNLMIGYALDSTEVLEKAVEYLKEHESLQD